MASIPIVALLAACQPRVEGELHSDSPLEIPLTEDRACILSAQWNRLRRNQDSASPGFPTIYPDNLRFVVNGRELVVTGTGGAPGGRSARWTD